MPVITTLAFFITLGVLIFAHELGHFLLAKKRGVRVEIFSLGFGPRLFGLKCRDTDYRISLVPIGGYVKMAGEHPEEKPKKEKWEFLSQPPGSRAQILIAGPLFNYLLAYLLFFLFFSFFPPFEQPAIVGRVMEGYPASVAGLKSGDRIVAIDDEKISSWGEMVVVIHNSQEALEFSVARGNERIAISITPRIEEREVAEGEFAEVGLVGIEPLERSTFYWAGREVVRITRLFFWGLGQVITQKVPAKDAFLGPVGMFGVVGDAVKVGPFPLVYITGLFSICLGIINIFPIPVLDGGHLLFLGLEKMRGRPVDLKVQEIATQIGMFLLLLLMLFVAYNDILRNLVSR